MLPCIVIDFFLNNQPDTLIIQIYYITKLHVLASSPPIIRSPPLYIWHWQVSCWFLMTASKQNQYGTANEFKNKCRKFCLPDCWIEVTIHPEDPSTIRLDTVCLGFSSVFKQVLRWFKKSQVATACYSCSPLPI